MVVVWELSRRGVGGIWDLRGVIRAWDLLGIRRGRSGVSGGAKSRTAGAGKRGLGTLVVIYIYNW
eukprot:COSAG02_NODE_2649_length_8330_cov_8.513605_8_plen_65_part_00